MQEYPSLSEAQSAVAKLVLLGLSNKEISERLHTSDKTVKYHITSIFKAAGVPSRHAFIANHYLKQIEILIGRLESLEQSGHALPAPR